MAVELFLVYAIFLLLNCLSFSPFFVFWLSTILLTRRTVCLSHLNIDRFLTFWASILPVCKEDVLDGVNVICKDVWTQKTRMDCSIMTLLFPLNFLLWNSTFKSCFSAVSKCLFLHAIFRDSEYLDNWILIRSFWRDPGIFFRARFRILLFQRLSVCHFCCVGFSRFFHTAEDCLSRLSVDCFLVFHFSRMSEDVVLDGVNVMCKDVSTNETWLDVLTWPCNSLSCSVSHFTLSQNKYVSFLMCGFLAILPHRWGLPKSFELRLLFKEFHFWAMSEAMFVGVKLMCKDVWTNETWLACCILTDTFVPTENSTLLWKLTFKSRFSAVAKGLLLHARLRDFGYLDQWNLIRCFDVTLDFSFVLAVAFCCFIEWVFVIYDV